jgi:hypothetical protein
LPFLTGVILTTLGSCRATDVERLKADALSSLEDELRQVDADAAGDRAKSAYQYLQSASKRRRSDDSGLSHGSLEYEKDLVKAGHCYYRSALDKGHRQSLDRNTEKEVTEDLRLAEEAFRQSRSVLGAATGRPEEAGPSALRWGLWWIATTELASVYLHDSWQRPRECRALLQEAAQTLPAGHPRLAKLLATEILVHAAVRDRDSACRSLETMLDQFPEAPELSRASLRVALLVEDATEQLVRDKGDRIRIDEGLRGACRYYASWLDSARKQRVTVRAADGLAAAESMYRCAMRINGFGESVLSFRDLHGRNPSVPQYLREAERVHALLLGGAAGELPERNRRTLLTRLARLSSFVARDADGWRTAKEHYDALLKSYGVLAVSGDLDDHVLRQHRELPGLYLETGYVYYELGKVGPRRYLGDASTIFANALALVRGASKELWDAEYAVLENLVDDGDKADAAVALEAITTLERKNPDFDRGEFGMKPMFLELKKRISGATRPKD